MKRDEIAGASCWRGGSWGQQLISEIKDIKYTPMCITHGGATNFVATMISYKLSLSMTCSRLMMVVTFACFMLLVVRVAVSSQLQVVHMSM